MTFEALQLTPPLLRALEEEGYQVPTPIQEQVIPYALAGRDVLGCAQTGTGKTAAFALPILQRLGIAGPAHARGRRAIRVLVLTPTRELASQIGDSFAAYGRHLPYRHAVIFGGVGQDAQTRALRAGLDVLVATPGRLLDLMQQGFVHLQDLEVFVLDEADRMLDMGFIHDVRKVIAKLPAKRQTLFFSATMPPDIADLAANLLTDPAEVAVTPVSSTVEKIEQSLYFVEKADKRLLLVDILRDPSVARALVFTRTKHGANRVAEHLHKAHVVSAAIHGNKSQSARERALDGFKKGQVRVLVATDIAARGIDVEGITHVINFELPNVPETYVHRIGRTARAGASGRAISFCEHEERPFLVDIERLIKQHVPVVTDHRYASSMRPPAPTELDPRTRRGGHPPRPAPQPQRQQQRPPQQQQQRQPQPHGQGGHGARPHQPAPAPRSNDDWGERREPERAGFFGASEAAPVDNGAGGPAGAARSGRRRRRRGGRGGGGRTGHPPGGAPQTPR